MKLFFRKSPSDDKFFAPRKLGSFVIINWGSGLKKLCKSGFNWDDFDSSWSFSSTSAFNCSFLVQHDDYVSVSYY